MWSVWIRIAPPWKFNSETKPYFACSKFLILSMRGYFLCGQGDNGLLDKIHTFHESLAHGAGSRFFALAEIFIRFLGRAKRCRIAIRTRNLSASSSQSEKFLMATTLTERHPCPATISWTRRRINPDLSRGFLNSPPRRLEAQKIFTAISHSDFGRQFSSLTYTHHLRREEKACPLLNHSLDFWPTRVS